MSMKAPVLRMSVQEAPTDLLIPRVVFNGDDVSVECMKVNKGARVIVLPLQKAPGIYTTEYLDYATMKLSQIEALIGFIHLTLGQREDIVRDMVESLFDDADIGLTQMEWVKKHTKLIKDLREG